MRKQIIALCLGVIFAISSIIPVPQATELLRQEDYKRQALEESYREFVAYMQAVQELDHHLRLHSTEYREWIEAVENQYN